MAFARPPIVVLLAALSLALAPRCATDEGATDEGAGGDGAVDARARLDAGGPDAAPDHDPAACAAFVVPTRFGLAWQDLNHRISRWRIALAPAPGAACRADALDVAYVGGDFTTGETATDTPIVDAAWLRVDAGAPTSLGAARVRVAATVTPPGVAEGQETYDRAALGLTGYPHVVALVEGLTLETDVPQGPDYPADYDPAHGYTSRGLGAAVAVAALDDGSLTLDWRVRFAHGRSDRDDMNRALQVARTGATLDVLLVGTAAATPRTGAVDYTLEYERPAPLADEPFPPASEAETAVTLAGPPGPFAGVYGLAGFDFALTPAEVADGDPEPGVPGPAPEDAGFYVRSLRVDVSLTEHDAATGEARFALAGHASNASGFLAFYALRHRFRGALVWLPAAVPVTAGALEEPFGTGAATFALP